MQTVQTLDGRYEMQDSVKPTKDLERDVEATRKYIYYLLTRVAHALTITSNGH